MYRDTAQKCMTERFQRARKEWAHKKSETTKNENAKTRKQKTHKTRTANTHPTDNRIHKKNVKLSKHTKSTWKPIRNQTACNPGNLHHTRTSEAESQERTHRLNIKEVWRQTGRVRKNVGT